MKKPPQLTRAEKINEIVRLAYGFQLTSLDNIKCIIHHVGNGYSDGEVIHWEREQFSHLDDKRIDQIYDVVIKFGTNEAESSGDTLLAEFNGRMSLSIPSSIL